MNTSHPWTRALGLTVLAAILWMGSARADWIWDVDGNRIDDRMQSVETSGLTAAHVGGLLSGKLRFAVMNTVAPFVYGVYIAYDHAPTEADAQALQAIGVPAQVRYRYIPYIRSTVSYAQALQVLALPGVRRVETIPILYPVNEVAAQTLRGRDSGNQIFPNAWKHLGVTGQGVVIAILDSGVNDAPYAGYPGHQSLNGKFLGGGNFWAGQPELNTPIDQSENPVHAIDPEATYHGTHVAGTALGSGGPQGVLGGAAPGFYAGVAPDARLVDIKALSDAGLGFGAADGLDWCIHHKNDSWGLTGADTVYRGIDIASMSLGGTDNSDGTDASSAAVNAAHRAGIVVVVATGNDGNTNWIASPSAADLAISVGSFADRNTVNRLDDIVADYSNEGPRLADGDSDLIDEMKPSVLGPGTGIMSALGDPTTAGDQYHHINGTSMATPAVSGLIALVLSANPSLTPDQVRQILQDTADHRTDAGKQPPSAVDPFGVDPNYHPSWGFGQPDAYAAVLEALNPFTTQVVRIAATPLRGPDGIHLEWWTQREHGLTGFSIDRAPDVLGGPGAWSEVHQTGVLSPETAIHAVANRHHYEWTDLDASLDPDALYWYRVRWIDASGASHAQPAISARIASSPVLARVRYSWTHDYSDGDLDVRFGTGTDPEHPVWFRQGEGSPAADSIVTVPGVAYTGTLRHYFHVDLTAADGIATFLPPSSANPWFLRVLEGGYINTLGSVNEFSVTVFGPGGEQTYTSPNPTVPTIEKTATTFWVPLDPITSLNHAPVLAPVGTRRVGEGLALQFTIGASDPDGNTLAYSASGLPSGATFDAGTRTFSWTPGFGAAGAYPVRFVVSDGAFPIAAADTEVVAIDVFDRGPGDNLPPLIDPLADRTVIEGERLAFRVTGRDPEAGALSYSVTGLPAEALLGAGDGTFSWQPNSGNLAEYEATFAVTDGGGLRDEQTITITVMPRQLSPGPPQACTNASFGIEGVVGMGTDPGEKSVTYHSFTLPSGVQSITGSLSWFGGPLVDLDFYLLDADSNAVQSSASINDPEVLTFNLPAAGDYIWKVVAFTNPDTSEYAIDYSLCIAAAAGVADGGVRGVRLAAPWPNPFRSRCALRFDLPSDADVRLEVFDVSGRRVRALHQGRLLAGSHVRVWDGLTDGGARARAGMYFYRLDARGADGPWTQTRRAVRID